MKKFMKKPTQYKIVVVSNKYIKKGHAKLEQLIELQNSKPWIIDALRYGNVRKGILEGHIDIDKLSKLTKEQIEYIKNRFEGQDLRETVEQYGILNSYNSSFR